MPYDELDDAYDRLRTTGPEIDGWLSNHGPMAAEALARHGHGSDIPAWLDHYCRRLDAAPRSSRRIEDWRTSLGDPRLVGDWLGWFEEELVDRPWREVLHTWWPRLLPGIAAGATHGVIRVGHAVRVLREGGETPERLAELAHGLGYWAARWQQVPMAVAPAGALSAESAIAAVPPVQPQAGGIRPRLERLEETRGWAEAQRAIAPSPDHERFLREVVSASVRRYATHAHGNPVMLVHSATAPNAVLRALPSLPADLWAASAAAAWSASAAIHAAYAPATGRGRPDTRATPGDAFDRAAQHGDEHVIKLADTALDVFSWTGDDLALAAISTAVDLIESA
jgi:hypothetical protein